MTFSADGIEIGTAAVSGGVATIAWTAGPAGTTTLTATYSGDADYAGSAQELIITVAEVVAPTDDPPAAAPAAGPELAATGAQMSLLAPAVALLMGGAVLLLLRRRVVG
ncbi:Ig-like domain repeat protein [Ruania sp. N2-46]|uniref:Ig-like domain repeat protein n=1 Tax=Occultella gossypii TaxID=2800820 RepID=A0ABS7SB87_9MICO|nr:Ig-like domain repeat protein [Occultella gossypii]